MKSLATNALIIFIFCAQIALFLLLLVDLPQIKQELEEQRHKNEQLKAGCVRLEAETTKLIRQYAMEASQAFSQATEREQIYSACVSAILDDISEEKLDAEKQRLADAANANAQGALAQRGAALEELRRSIDAAMHEFTEWIADEDKLDVLREASEAPAKLKEEITALTDFKGRIQDEQSEFREVNSINWGDD